MNKKLFSVTICLLLLVAQACSASTATPVESSAPATNTTVPPIPTFTKTPPPTKTIEPTPTAIPLTWKQVSTGQEFIRDTVIGFEIDPNNGDVLYIRMENAGYYISIDAGNSWQTSQYTQIPPTIQSALSINRNFNNKWDYTITHVGPDKINRIYRAKWSVSENGGKNWREFGIGGETSSNAITFDHQGYAYIFCDFYLCKYSPDGKQRFTLGKPDVGAFTIISFSPFDSDVLYVAGSGIAESKDGGLTWNKLNNGLGSAPVQLDISLNKPLILYLQSGTCNDSDYGPDNAGQPLYFSTDQGRSWIPSIETGCYLIRDANGFTIFRVGQDVWSPEGNFKWRSWLWRSQDNGATWQKIYVPGFMQTIIAHPAESGILYGYKEDLLLAEVANYISKDYGHTWKIQEPHVGTRPCYGSTPRFIDAYRPMSIDPQNGDHVLYVKDSQVFESNNSCINITQLNLTIRMVNSIVFDLNNPDVLYAGTNEGAYISIDSGKIWDVINDGLPDTKVVYSIVADKDSNVYAATPYGIYQLVKP